jgi:hypothetical protein
MKTIPLTQGKEAIVDEQDYKYLMQWKWYFAKHKRSGYAARKWSCPKHLTLMHKIIATRKGLTGEIDHHNQNKLDNRRRNLRPATRSQNVGNCGLRATNTSGFKGVSWYRAGHQWRARIVSKAKERHLGYFPPTRAGKIAAARAYNKAALEYFGEYAHLNKV